MVNKVINVVRDKIEKKIIKKHKKISKIEIKITKW